MAIDTRTANRNYPQLVPANDLRDDATRLVVTFQMIDADVHALFAGLAATAPADHGHGIAAIAGLQAALDARQSIDWRPALNDLTNVDTTGATNGQVLGRIGGAWAPLTLAIGNVGGLQAALDGKAATGHVHAIGDVAGLQNTLDGKAASSFRPPLSELADVDLATAPPAPGDTLVFDGATWVPGGGGGGVPAGMIADFAMNAPPAGWLKANGALVSRTTYADLFAAIGTTYGAGDGSTTFALPDFRGEFRRGWDDGRGVDGGRVFGSAQLDQYQDHVHSIQAVARFNDVNIAALGYGNNTTPFNNSGSFTRTSLSGGDSIRAGSETRPRNIAALICIKY